MRYVISGILGLLSFLIADPVRNGPDLRRTDNATSHCTEVFSERTYFYAGGQYVASESGTVMIGQIYVERLVPLTVTKQHPLVFIHGSAQTGSNWLNAPDGRQGWASYFLEQGYIVYVTDQPERGRSPWQPGDGLIVKISAEITESLFIAPEQVSPLPYPQASSHTQWPGAGVRGDPIFDALYASQVQFQANDTITTALNKHAYSALLEGIGTPAFLICHSQAGPFCWQIADSVPSLIQGIVGIEPGTTPFTTWTGPPFAPGYLSPFSPQPWGITWLPVQYDPPIGNDASLLRKQNVSAPNPSLAPCMLQAEPARRLVNIAQVPQLIITSQASWHAVGDYCTATYLKQAGCPVEHVPLESVGIYGNGHFLFMELNNIQIAQDVVLPWLEKMAA